MPCPDVPPIDEGRWLEGNGGVARFYSQGPVEAGQFSPEGVITESLVENWWLRREYSHNYEQMNHRLDLVCNRMDFRGIPISFCQFDLGGLGGRISGDGAYIGQRIDQHEDRIVQVDARSLSLRQDGPRLGGPLDIRIGGEAGHTHGIYFSGIEYANNKPEVNKKAEKLLLSFLDPMQKRYYKRLKRFEHLEKDAKREWQFHFRYHYPVEFRNPDDNFIGLCIELENKTPTEDILLMCLLEVRGGRGDDIIRAGKRNPQPLRDDQRLHRGASPETIEFLGSEAELRRFSEQWRETMERGRTAFGDLEQAFRRVALLTHQFPQEYLQQEDRRTATEVQNAEPLTLEQLRECFQAFANISITRKVSCSSEAYGDLIRRNDIVLNEGVSINIATNDLYIGSLWGIELYVDPDQREPFRPMEG